MLLTGVRTVQAARWPAAATAPDATVIPPVDATAHHAGVKSRQWFGPQWGGGCCCAVAPLLHQVMQLLPVLAHAVHQGRGQRAFGCATPESPIGMWGQADAQRIELLEQV